MGFILVVNSGSSSVKFQLINIETEQKMLRGAVEKIGTPDSCYRISMGNEREEGCIEIKDHRDAVEFALKFLHTHAPAHWDVLKHIVGVGHRVVQGGNSFDRPMLVNEEVKEKIREYGKMAPLHNYANLAGIEACEALMPSIPQVVVFDTTFHQTIPPKAYLYGIPYEYYEKYGVRKYGAHGTSHKFVCKQAEQLLDLAEKPYKMIVCHLGNGSSISAIQNGEVIDTSMGFTPLEGLMMGTRSGDIDPAAVLYLMEQEELSPKDMDHILNKKSGLLGVSGLSNDMRDLRVAITWGNKRAHLAYDMFIYRIKKMIGSYVAALNGLDVLIFTAGIGENESSVRSMICQDMDYCGIMLDEKRNNYTAYGEIGVENSRVKILVLPTDEEMEIAKETAEVILGIAKK